MSRNLHVHRVVISNICCHILSLRLQASHVNMCESTRLLSLAFCVRPCTSQLISPLPFFSVFMFCVQVNLNTDSVITTLSFPATLPITGSILCPEWKQPSTARVKRHPLYLLQKRHREALQPKTRPGGTTNSTELESGSSRKPGRGADRSIDSHNGCSNPSHPISPGFLSSR